MSVQSEMEAAWAEFYNTMVGCRRRIWQGHAPVEMMPGAQHSVLTPAVFERLFCDVRPDRVIHISTDDSNVLSRWLVNRGLAVTEWNSVSKKKSEGFIRHRKDPLKNLAAIKRLLTENKRCLVICDGENKSEEFRSIAPWIKDSDVIMVHDFFDDDEDFEKAAFEGHWSWVECTLSDVIDVVRDSGLRRLHRGLMRKCGWGCWGKLPREMDQEREFWTAWVKGDYCRELLTKRPLGDKQDGLLELLPKKKKLRILDIGAGCLSVLGTEHPTAKVEIVQLDPLSDFCRDLMRQAGHRIDHKRITGNGESLRELVKDEEPFDLIYSSNAIDHTEDPFRVLSQIADYREMHGSAVYLKHYENCGRINQYLGLHQWDFFPQVEDYVLKGTNGMKHVLSKIFHDPFEVRHSEDDHGRKTAAILQECK